MFNLVNEAMNNVAELNNAVEMKEETEMKNYPEVPANLPMWYYSAPLFSFINLFDTNEQMFVKNFSNAKYDSEVAGCLSAFLEYEHSIMNSAFVAADAEFCNLPSSMFAYICCVKPDSRFEGVADVSYSEENFNDLLALYGKRISKQARVAIMDLRKQIHEALVTRLIRNGFSWNGRAYVFYTSSPAGLKKMSAYFLSAEIAMRHNNLFWFGMNPEEINKNTKNNVVFTKLMQWRALFFSAAVPSSVVFGHPIRPDHCFVTSKVKITVNETVDHVDLTGNVTRELVDTDRAFGDGQNILNPNHFGKAVCQIRNLGCKGLAVGFDIAELAKKLNKKPIVKDVEGNEHNVETEDWDMILTPDTFKMLKAVGGCWSNAVELAKKIGINEFFICGIAAEGKKVVNISRQMNSSLIGIDDAALKEYLRPTVKKLNAHFSVEGAVKMLREDAASEKTGLAQLLQVYPEAIQLKQVMRKAQLKHQLQWCKACGGTITVPGRSQYVVDDPVIMALGFLGCDPMDLSNDLLSANEVFIPDMNRTGIVTLLRSPHAYMEWAILNLKDNDELRFWYPEHVVVLNARDNTPRILMCDVDGDHLVYPESENIARNALNIRKRFDIIPIIYDAFEGKGNAIAASRNEFYAQVLECIFTCHEYNLVGRYSNLQAHIWADIDKIPENAEEAAEKLHEAAWMASNINHAVDAQKTYKMIPISESVVREYALKPWNQRFYAARAVNSDDALTDYQDEAWDNITMPKKLGTIDRIADIVSKAVSPDLTVDTSVMDKFSWNMLIGKKPVMLYNAAFNSKLLKSVGEIGKATTQEDVEALQEIRNGKPIGIIDLLRLVMHLRAQNLSVFTKNENSELVRTEHYKRQIENINKLLANFVYVGNKIVRGMSYEEIRELIANRIAYVLSNGNNDDLILFAFEIFGDIYAENVQNNKNIVVADLGASVVNEAAEPLYAGKGINVAE